MTTISKVDIQESSMEGDRQYLTIKQASRKYPCLFSHASLASNIGRASHLPARWRRPRTGITVQLLQHGQLTPEQFEAIGEYRLDQYVLAGFYDGKRVAELGLKSDPALARALDSTLHLVIGDAEHHMLCYVSFEAAHISPPGETSPETSSCRATGPTAHPWMGDQDRLLFPVEVDYGQHLYTSHPGIRLLPVATVREISRLVRNQAIQGPLTTLATTEVIVATSQLLRTDRNHIEAIIGCASPQVRHFLNRFNIPIAYAPEAVDHLGESPASLDADIWSPSAHEPGKFWPIVLSSTDTRVECVYHDALNDALNSDFGHILEACQEALQYTEHRLPRYCYNPDTLHESESCESANANRTLRWVPYFDPKTRRETTLENGMHQVLRK